MTLEILYTLYIHQYLNRTLVKGFTLILVIIKGGKIFANRDLPSLHRRRKLILVVAGNVFKGQWDFSGENTRYGLLR